MNHFEIEDLKKAETDTMSQVIMSQHEVQTDIETLSSNVDDLSDRIEASQ